MSFIMLCHVMSFIMLCHIMLCHSFIMLCHIMLCHSFIMLCHMSHLDVKWVKEWAWWCQRHVSHVTHRSMTSHMIVCEYDCVGGDSFIMSHESFKCKMSQVVSIMMSERCESRHTSIHMSARMIVCDVTRSWCDMSRLDVKWVKLWAMMMS